MESLEAVLRKVEDLRRDLSAEIVDQEEERHEEHFEPSFPESTSDKGMRDFLYGYDVWIIDQPRIARPDTQKRESARTKLQQIYDTSEWYSARYAAANMLGENTRKLEDMALNFIKALDHVIRSLIDSPYLLFCKEREAEDMKALSDMVTLGRLSSPSFTKSLFEIYYRCHPNRNIRKKAGESLGYKNLDT